MEEIEMYLEEARELMDKSVNHCQQELLKIRAGKAMPNMLDGLMVEYYGTMTPINQVSSVTTPDARTLSIKPFEKSILGEIERVIINSDLGLNPQNDGEQIRINIPPLTEERRLGLMKQVRAEAENGKISVRNVRKDTNDSLKALIKEGVSEDAVKGAEAEVQKLTDKHVVLIDELVVVKEKDIMTI
ncbi:ribosome recycling factor [Reichenbachiella carrageenanivorans]|uniref:Ribosome-recycling factor n=1 Tax=Reichenbachiella carrageenanivorans TaxID=2979869 RepID=A0ABY6D2Z3_9BACT|nr:ribosome recycling factor [Reichenbachiella carrageenanivorans]UXX79995.1 ribosome recycling factor [Reichenbachiella carrageenanivorans]